MSVQPVTETDLHAYLDGTLPPARAAEVEAYLADHPDEAGRIAAYRNQIETMRRAFDPVLDETVPEEIRLRHASRTQLFKRVSALAVSFVGGVIAGWYLHAYDADKRIETTAWARRAAVAHVVYSPEVRHPVEVGVDQEAHLVAWLSKRLGTPLKIPYLGNQGYNLVGGRLLPGDRGPVAQFMYQDGKGQRLTLYIRVNPDESRETAFRFAQERGVGVFYWLDRKLGYALSGEIDKAELLRLATAVHLQLNP